MGEKLKSSLTKIKQKIMPIFSTFIQYGTGQSNKKRKEIKEIQIGKNNSKYIDMIP